MLCLKTPDGTLHSLEHLTLPPQGGRSLSEPMCSSVFPQISGFVRMSATITWVGQYAMVIVLSATASWMKWNYRSMCFVLAWN